MKVGDKVTHRLALLDGVDFSDADLESIAAEIEDLERIVAELEKFGEATPWISLQTQPSSPKG
jgi:hypothetical protein